jgi:2-polyprenyl-3-methyl-5-hydroxy-6-metoxy-1,4-benzoquinol methylase
MTQAAVQERLAREVEFFERLYADEAARGIAPLSDFDRRRYTNPPASTIFPREFYYHLLAPLQGLDTLEMACGNGIDASICAHNGANVHAYDIARQSVDFTRRRAQVNGLGHRLKLQVTGQFTEAFAGQTFDRILGYAALHHIPMEGLAQQVYDRLRPGGVAVFAEPVINSHALHALRRCVPYYLFPPTDDEVPLNDGQIAEFARPFDRFVRREFQLTSRIWPFFPSSWALAYGLHWLDSWLLKLPPLRRFATVVVFACYRDR